jgi:hypothetical protein
MDTPAFDIFRLDADGSVRWIASTDTMHDAMQKVKEQIALQNLSHVILDSVTGERTVVSP